MHVELLVPGLYASRDPAGRLPALEMLIARGRRSTREALSPERWLAGACGLEDALPAGALTLLAASGNPGVDRWMRVDPVHLLQQRDLLVLVPPPAIRIAHEEAAALAATLNAHFGAELEIDAGEPEAWCARGVVPEALATLPPLEAAGRAVRALPPEAKAERWHALLNEAQMLLHGHPVNAAREARGERTVNSLWFWGPGALPAEVRFRWRSVATGDPVTRGLALAGKAQPRLLPEGAGAWLAGAPADGRHLVQLEALRAANATDDGEGWQRALQQLEEAWIAPLMEMLRADRIGMISLHVPDGPESRSYELVRGDLRRFWKRPKPLGS